MMYVSSISSSPGKSRTDYTKISQRMVGLKDSCLHPTSKQPYIKSASGGTDNSPEGLQVLLHLFSNLAVFPDIR